MTPTAVVHAGDARLAPFRDPHRPGREDLVVEGTLLVRRLLAVPGVRLRAVLATAPALAAIADALPGIGVPVLVAPRAVVAAVAGYPFHRGMIALADRPPPATLETILARRPRRLVVLERVTSAANVGAIFRSARALGADGVLLAPGCADPLAPQALRASVGCVLAVPYAPLAPWPAALADLRAAGLGVVALTTAPDAVPVDALPRARALALVAGTEATGLAPATLAHAEVRATIRMAPGGDSLNVATAVAIALHALGPADA